MSEEKSARMDKFLDYVGLLEQETKGTLDVEGANRLKELKKDLDGYLKETAPLTAERRKALTRYLEAGKDTNWIANRLNISYNTIDVYRKEMKKRKVTK